MLFFFFAHHHHLTEGDYIKVTKGNITALLVKLFLSKFIVKTIKPSVNPTLHNTIRKQFSNTVCAAIKVKVTGF